MKKARTLLAIWLALILTLTLFPTALATGDGNGDTPQEFTVNAIAHTPGILSGSLTQNVTDGKWTPDIGNLVFTFKLDEGYASPTCNLTINNTKVSDIPISPSDGGVYTLTIPQNRINGNIGVEFFAEKAASQSGNDDQQPENAPPGNDPTAPQPKNTYTITFKTTGDIRFSDGKTEKEIKTDENGTFEVISDEPTIANHSFLGWFYKNKYYFSGEKVTVSSDATLTARVLHNVTIAFTAGADVDSNAVSGIPETKSDYKPDSTISLPTPSRVGYNFQGWSDGNNVYTSEFKVPYDLKDPYTVTLTATWEPASKITIDYDKGLAKTASIPVDTFVYQPADGGPTTFNISNDKPSRHDGSYSFSGWRYSVDNKLYNPGNTITIPAGTTSVKLTAEWSPATYPDYDEDDDRPSKPSKPSKPTYDEYRIRATCSDGGWVSPAGSSYVREGRNLTVTFAPYKGYAIDGVYIDGVLDNRYDGSYTFRDVDENHTIYVRYVRDSGSSGGSSGGGSHWDDNTSPKTGDASAPLSMGLGVGSLALIAFLVARKMRRA